MEEHRSPISWCKSVSSWNNGQLLQTVTNLIDWNFDFYWKIIISFRSCRKFFMDNSMIRFGIRVSFFFFWLFRYRSFSNFHFKALAIYVGYISLFSLFYCSAFEKDSQTVCTFVGAKARSYKFGENYKGTLARHTPSHARIRTLGSPFFSYTPLTSTWYIVLVDSARVSFTFSLEGEPSPCCHWRSSEFLLFS